MTPAGIAEVATDAGMQGLAINKAHYKPRHIAEKVVEDRDKPLPALCDKRRTRQTRKETKSSTWAFLKTMCSRVVGNLNEYISRCNKHISMQYQVEDTARPQMTKRARSEEMRTGQESRHGVDMDKPKPIRCEQPEPGLVKEEAK